MSLYEVDIPDDSFNRTFMELKFNPLRPRNSGAQVLIVPLWN